MSYGNERLNFQWILNVVNIVIFFCSSLHVLFWWWLHYEEKRKVMVWCNSFVFIPVPAGIPFSRYTILIESILGSMRRTIKGPKKSGYKHYFFLSLLHFPLFQPVFTTFECLVPLWTASVLWDICYCYIKCCYIRGYH